MKIKHIIILPTSFFAIRTKVTFSSHMYARISKECVLFSKKQRKKGNAFKQNTVNHSNSAIQSIVLYGKKHGTGRKRKKKSILGLMYTSFFINVQSIYLKRNSTLKTTLTHIYYDKEKRRVDEESVWTTIVCCLNKNDVYRLMFYHHGERFIVICNS